MFVPMLGQPTNLLVAKPCFKLAVVQTGVLGVGLKVARNIHAESIGIDRKHAFVKQPMDVASQEQPPVFVMYAELCVAVEVSSLQHPSGR